MYAKSEGLEFSTNLFDLFTENNVMKYFKELPKMKIENYKGYALETYMRSYAGWSVKCESDEDSKPIGPEGLHDVISISKSIRAYAITILVFACLITTAALFNYFILCIKNRSYKERVKKLTNFRMIITFIFSLVIWFCLWRLMVATEDDTPEYIANSKCSLDPILNDQLGKMHSY